MSVKSSPNLARLTRQLEEADEERPYESIKGAIYKLVEIFSAISQKKIWVTNANNASSDGCKIEAPLESPLAYETVEHFIAHILFKSDPVAKHHFSKEYARSAQRGAARQGVEIHLEALENAILDIVGILDTHRVSSLWALLYPGSSARIRRMRQDIYLAHADCT